ncbi:hypothetical protein LCGC14_3108620 [marine sediment metagenome]|uniref:Uncharacterized protein n=1 Tax=marine sediment metagenome TaxID=412755 RepID=A0A0F8YVM5_9ZZZZ
MTLRTFETDEEKWVQFKALCAKEGVKIGKKLNDFIDKEIKEHGDGNPAFTLDQFVDNPGMQAVPAFYRTAEDWEKYLSDNLTQYQTQVMQARQAVLQKQSRDMDL